MILDNTLSIELLLGSAVVANELAIAAGYADIVPNTSYDTSPSKHFSNGTTAVTIIAAPSSGTKRKVSYISVYNRDTADAQVTIRINDGTNVYVQVNITIPVNSTLQYSDTAGWMIVKGVGSTGLAGVNAQTGTSYTSILGDANKLITLNNASAITLTVPTNASVAYPVGTPIYLAQIGAGTVSVVGDSGVTVHNASTASTRAQYSILTLIKIDTNTWLLAGDMT